MIERNNAEESSVPSAISVEGVSVDLENVRVLEDVTFAIDHGVMVALVGPNGAGRALYLRQSWGFCLFPRAGC